MEFGEPAMMVLARTSKMQSLTAGDAPVQNSQSQAHVAEIPETQVGEKRTRVEKKSKASESDVS